MKTLTDSNNLDERTVVYLAEIFVPLYTGYPQQVPSAAAPYDLGCLALSTSSFLYQTFYIQHILPYDTVEAQARLRDQLKLPTGYFVEWGGQFRNLREASERLAIAVPAALALILILLFMTYGSVRPALLTVVVSIWSAKV